ncbi:MAG: peptidase M48 [Candidatus Dactylopiibacterium carminicum]|uniref:Peptidase M48 n=1 Tax=Candidatus Dactylopiibacterium carminicum TaxID=857335 RepID=A0A272ERV0_9RHOO|nr:M48 family metallopeptidase [Candidatus Dactylopiibacterium carminicum]KAF7598886.1 peptidase M48 [Candidatus Dactylopiibacterium carminicum]PAS92815.1 MAG: peptidase M48 [Candidatus Dactylopiibacterium carminicum]PAS96266.1 MAG: peptidase M48 [Candidatus Dactylopiibacterium carminicum]PAS98904.1 MAG: peptidase M48 [Candidatus Dactylopiibacterium carminicum]
MKQISRPWVLAVILGLGVIAGCQTVQTTAPGVVGVNRQQHVSPLINRDQLNQQATLQYQQVLKEADGKRQLNQDAAMLARVRRIADRIIPQVKTFRPEAASWKWEVNVIKSDELNAWCMPGGKIAFYSGLIEQLKATDDELAQVMGHEIAHALREHAWERASKSATAGLGISILGAGEAHIDMASMVYNVTFELPNSREHETEADRIGIELAARAGYDPRAAVTLWQKMGKASGSSSSPKWLSTHPASTEREQDLRYYGDLVMPLYGAGTQALIHPLTQGNELETRRIG